MDGVLYLIAIILLAIATVVSVTYRNVVGALVCAAGTFALAAFAWDALRGLGS